MDARITPLVVVALLIVLAGGGYMVWAQTQQTNSDTRTGTPGATDLDPTPRPVTLAGRFTCLPHKDQSGPQTEECAFGLRTDGGEYYAVDAAQLSSTERAQLENGQYITAEGTVVIKEALSSNQWAKYDMKGVFTVTRILGTSTGAPNVSTKLNINTICEGALAYMTFPDGAAAAKFVSECKEGQHPEVIEEYKRQVGIDGAVL